VAAIAEVSDKIAGGDEAKGKKCEDEVHDLLLLLIVVDPYTVCAVYG
jgi:hypothetical protein